MVDLKVISAIISSFIWRKEDIVGERRKVTMKAVTGDGA